MTVTVTDSTSANFRSVKGTEAEVIQWLEDNSVPMHHVLGYTHDGTDYLALVCNK